MNTAWDMFVYDLRQMLNAETKLVHALGEMERESNAPELQEAFREHRKQTEGHAVRLIDIMRDIGQTPEQGECKGIDGLVEEKNEFIKYHPSEDLLELFNIGAAIKSERYEISAYEALIRMAEELGALNAARLMEQTLKEEQEALHKLQEFTGRVTARELGISGNIEGGLSRKVA